MKNSKKKNPNRIQCSMADIKRYQKQMDAEWEAREQDVYTQASQRVSVWYQAITYLALCNIYDFTSEDLFKLQTEMERISDKIMATEGKHRNYTIDTVRKELKKYDVEFDMDEIEAIENGEKV